MATSAKAVLSAAEFECLGAEFAARSAGLSPTWAWNEHVEDDAFGRRLAGCLVASPLLIAAADDARESEQEEDPAVSSDAGAFECARSARLLLHIVYSASYGVPVLLLQGYGADGMLWTPSELREHLLRRGTPGHAGVAPGLISQMEHPVLRTPFCCVDPCNTAALMADLLGGGGAVGAPVETLDYLSAWWAVLAPLVGCTVPARHAHRAPAAAAVAPPGACGLAGAVRLRCDAELAVKGDVSDGRPTPTS